MKSFQSLVAILAAIIMINTPVVMGSSLEKQQQSQLEQIQVEDNKRKRILSAHPPKVPSTGGSGGSSSGSSGGGSSGGSGSGSSSGSGSGGSGSGGSGSGGSGGSGSGGSGGGGSGSGGGGSGGGVSGGGGSGDGGIAQANSGIKVPAAKKSLVMMLSIAAVAGMAIAAIAIPRRKVATENEHALKGSLNRRIELFSNLAKHAPSRPPRRDEVGRYINADTIV